MESISHLTWKLLRFTKQTDNNPHTQHKHLPLPQIHIAVFSLYWSGRVWSPLVIKMPLVSWDTWNCQNVSLWFNKFAFWLKQMLYAVVLTEKMYLEKDEKCEISEVYSLKLCTYCKHTYNILRIRMYKKVRYLKNSEFILKQQYFIKTLFHSMSSKNALKGKLQWVTVVKQNTNTTG